MRPTLTLAAVTLAALVADADPPTPPGGVTVSEIHIRRYWVSQPRSPAAGELKLVLQVAVPPDVRRAGKDLYFARLHLDPIRDDTGKVLSGEDFVEQLASLRGYNNYLESWEQGEGAAATFGADLELYLDLPERRATTLRRIKGEVEVGAGRQETLRFPDLQKIAGRPIESPHLAGLKITPVIHRQKGKTVVGLRVAGDATRVLYWSAVNDGDDFSTMSEPSQMIEGGAELRQWVYNPEDENDDALKGTGLHLKVFVPGPTRRVAFDLKDVPLP